MLEAVVIQAIGQSSGPEILIFKRFKNSWSNIKKESFDNVYSDVLAFNDIENVAAELITFSQQQLKKYQPIDDYKELLIFFGSRPKTGTSFRDPAGLHRAR
ncbi:unnamed protein product [Brassicogethes aeneus]|uniref:Uncharacterized protein n=1 Tax=Brassicogethes aeneus TaxID=1431903 RepID=A0A9P0AWE2_BRAAE|nr:unnamed protein product [Brassicogethes aeneus]